VVPLVTVIRLLGAVVLALSVLASGASATTVRDAAIDPGTPVNGMVVVQGLAGEADATLFGGYCDPIVVAPGRRTRTCSVIPHVRQLFVGHGTWAVKKRIDAAWNKQSWAMWIDGDAVELSRFGHSDRWLSHFAPAGGRDVVLREWSIVLTGARGRHSIRYRTRLPEGVFDTTWRFRVAAS
jgi:hypothetical protein